MPQEGHRGDPPLYIYVNVILYPYSGEETYQTLANDYGDRMMPYFEEQIDIGNGATAPMGGEAPLNAEAEIPQLIQLRAEIDQRLVSLGVPLEALANMGATPPMGEANPQLAGMGPPGGLPQPGGGMPPVPLAPPNAMPGGLLA